MLSRIEIKTFTFQLRFSALHESPAVAAAANNKRKKKIYELNVNAQLPILSLFKSFRIIANDVNNAREDATKKKKFNPFQQQQKTAEKMPLITQ